MNTRKKILFIYTHYSSFVKTDYEILSSEFEIVKYQFIPHKGFFKVGLQFLKQFLYLVINIWHFDLLYIWFADYHTFWPVIFAKIFRKKSFVVIGGYDVARLKTLGYGVFISRLRGFFSVFAMNNCTLNLTVSKYVDRKVNGIAKNAQTNLIYNCVSLNKSALTEDSEKENLIVTVGIIEKEQTFYIKGIDTFIEVARQLPKYKFLIIGLNSEKLAHLLYNLPDNLKIEGKIRHQELVTYYKQAKIYCQLSRSESFGVALTEAIYFGCTPIVTNVGGLPEIVNTKRLIVKRNYKEIANTIEDILIGDRIPESNVKDRILTMFKLEIRKKNIIETLKTEYA